MGIKWLSIWFNEDVKGCLKMLDQIDSELKGNLAFGDHVKPIVRRKLIHNAKQVTEIIHAKNRSYRDFVLFQIANIATDQVVSGRYHVYRGLLSMIGEDINRIFLYAINELGKSGFHTSKEVDEARAYVRKEIASVG